MPQLIYCYGGLQPVILSENCRRSCRRVRPKWQSQFLHRHRKCADQQNDYLGERRYRSRTATPAAELTVSANSGMTFPDNNVFEIASSTPAATTTLFSVANTGNATLAGTLTQTPTRD